MQIAIMPQNPFFEITLNDGTVKEVTGTTDITSDVKSVKLLADYNKSWSVEQTASGARS